MTPPLDEAHAQSGTQADATAALRAAVFIDLAGILLDSPPAPRALPGLRGGVGAALRLLDRLDYRLLVLAPCTRDRRQGAKGMPARIADLLARERVALAGCYCCAAGSAPCSDCPPAPVLLQRGAREHGLALEASWLLGRDVHYLVAGQRAGCRTLIVGVDGEGAWPAPLLSGDTAAGPAAYQARDIVDAALAIIRLDEDR